MSAARAPRVSLTQRLAQVRAELEAQS
jgi:hypothetical protein